MLPCCCISPPGPHTCIMFSSFHPSSAFPSSCPRSQISNPGHASFPSKLRLFCWYEAVVRTGYRGKGDSRCSSLCSLHSFLFFCNTAVCEAKLDVWNSFPTAGAHSNEPPPQQVPRGFRWVGKYNQI